VMDMLDAGDAYRAGYGAVLRAPRDIPPPDAVTPPVLITAYDGDPLQAHIDRLGPMPAGWTAQKVATPAEHHAQSLAFLKGFASAHCDILAEDRDAGFVRVTAPGFDGLIHHDGTHIDPPGNGLSDDWLGKAPLDWPSWQAVFDAFAEATGRIVTLPPLPKGDPERLYPALTPDRFGTHLTTAWSIARARVLFDPWYDASAASALPVDPERLAPEQLARDTLAILRARAAKALHIARMGDD
jgi:haloalkane dehalogenase